jgi:hypothetical protein
MALTCTQNSLNVKCFLIVAKWKHEIKACFIRKKNLPLFGGGGVLANNVFTLKWEKELGKISPFFPYIARLHEIRFFVRHKGIQRIHSKQNFSLSHGLYGFWTYRCACQFLQDMVSQLTICEKLHTTRRFESRTQMQNRENLFTRILVVEVSSFRENACRTSQCSTYGGFRIMKVWIGRIYCLIR